MKQGEGDPTATYMNYLFENRHLCVADVLTIPLYFGVHGISKNKQLNIVWNFNYLKTYLLLAHIKHFFSNFF